MKRMFRKESGEIDMVSLVLTVVIAAVTLLVGIVIVSNMETTTGLVLSGVNGNATNATGSSIGCGVDWCRVPFGQSATLSTSFTNVLTGTGTAFNFLALGLFVLAAVFVIGIVAGVLGRSE